MRSLVVMMMLCACLVAWGVEKQQAPAKPFLQYELSLDATVTMLQPKWMNELRLLDQSLYRFDEFKKDLLGATKETLDESNPRQMDLKRNLLGSVANTGYLGDLPPDTVYQPAHEEQGTGGADARNAAEESRNEMMKQGLLGSVANTGQLGDAPSDEVYQGGAASGSDQAVGDARQQAFEEAKKKNSRNVMKGQVTNGGYTDNPDDGKYDTNIQQGGKRNIQVGEDRIPYLIKQLSAPQNPNKNPSDIHREIRQQMMKQQIIQTNPYQD